MKRSKRVACPRRSALSNQTMSADDPVRGFVWTLKVNGKVASGIDVHRRALIRRADQLTSVGQGGGIVDVLIPRDPRTLRRLQRDRVRYELSLVRARGAGERQKTRDLLAIQTFLGRALAMAPAGCLPYWKAKGFLEWLVMALRVRGSDVYRLASRTFPLLLEQDRSVRWWQNRVSELKKKQKMSR
jgi:hypothetical protein